ncbi:MAG: hypothetical protein ACRC0J_07485, partial [Shewanella oncorhynchi]
ELYTYGESSGDPEWKSYTWKSADILSEDTIESAKRSLDELSFKREYEASFNSPQGRIYADFGAENVSTEALCGKDVILWAHDFNFTPLSSCIMVQRGDSIHAIDEIVIDGAVAINTAIEFCIRYKDHQKKEVHIFGDASGRVGEIHRQSSNYSVIEEHLRNNSWAVTRKVKLKNPSIQDRHNAVRRKICNGKRERSLFVNVNRCKTLFSGLNSLQFKTGSAYQEANTRDQHITTAIGYCIEYLFPVTTDNRTIQALEPNTYTMKPMWRGNN